MTRGTSFGAFVDIGKGVEGLIPPSDMQNSRADLHTLFKGMHVNVEVMEIDRQQERIILHLDKISA